MANVSECVLILAGGVHYQQLHGTYSVGYCVD